MSILAKIDLYGLLCTFLENKVTEVENRYTQKYNRVVVFNI